MTLTRRAALPGAVGLALAIAALGGCGGDTRRAETESVSTQTPPSMTAAQPGKPAPVAAVTDPARRAYIARTDAICRAADSERNRAREDVDKAADPQEAAHSYGQETTLAASELRRIEAVPPPAGDGQLLRANVFDPVRQQLALRARMRAALAVTDVPRLRALREQLDNISRALAGFARGYGWRACGEG